MRCVWAAPLLVLCLTTAASARDLFVNNVTGDDRRTGTSPVLTGGTDGPFRTIRRALRAVRKGDRLIVAKTDKPYRESITLQAGRHSGVRTQPFELIGNGAVLDGTREIPYQLWRYIGRGVWRFRPRRLTRQLLYLDGKPAKKRNAPGDKLPKLEPKEWCLHKGYIYFFPEEGKTPGDYPLAHTSRAVGLTLYEVQHVIVRDFVFQGFQLDGVNAHDSVFNTRLEGLVSRGNARSGIAVCGASRVTIERSLLGNNGEAQVWAEGFSKTEIEASDILDNTAPRIRRAEGAKVIEKNAPRAAAIRDLFGPLPRR